MSATHPGSKRPAAPPWQPSALGVACLVGLLLLAVSSCRWSGPPTTAPVPEENLGPPLFHDVTAESGVKFTYRNGEEAGHYAILESLGGGMAAIDFDGDGRIDLFLAGGGYYDGPNKKQIKGHPCRLYRNVSGVGGGFQFEDVTAKAGLDKIDFYTHGAAVGDFDNDGWPDLLVTGWGKLLLFHNEPIDPKDPKKGRTFVDVTAKSGLTQGLWTTSAAWGDLDGDGYPDLYVCQYVDWSFEHNHPLDCTYDGKTKDVCPPKRFTGLEHRLFRNKGDGTFTDVSKPAGLRVARTPDEYKQLDWLDKLYEKYEKKKAKPSLTPGQDRMRQMVTEGDTKFGKGLGVLMIDVNGDGKPDIYVANDTVDNFLYVNHTPKVGVLRFDERGLESGTARDDSGAADGSMGTDAGDPFGTGRPAIWVTNYENELHALYRNECRPGHDFFLFASKTAGIAAIGQTTVGWGTGFLDVDHHGWEDLFFTDGHAIRHPTHAPRAQRPVLFRNEGDGKFKDLSKRGGAYFEATHVGRGAVLADFDNDGRIDLAICHQNEPVAVLRNEADTGHNHWLGVELAGKGHRDVVGARVIVEAAGRKQTRFAKGGGSYASAPDRRHVFGLGPAAAIDRLTVIWPNGEEQHWQNLALDRYYRLTEGDTDARALYGK